MKTPVLQTQRLTLRPVTIEDAPAIQKHFNNWNIIKNLSKKVPWPYPDNGAEQFLKEMLLPKTASGEEMAWAITEKGGSGELIGLVHFRFKAEEEGNRGFWLAEPFHGRGYMTEAVEAVQDYIFFELKVDKIRVTNAVFNEASRRIKEKTGAQYVGRAKIEHHGGAPDSDLWEVTRESWAQLRGRALA